MKEDIKNGIIVVVIICAVLGLAFYFSNQHIKGIREDMEMCSENLGIEWNGEDEYCGMLICPRSNIHYKKIDKTHYNCCWDERGLSDEKGYWIKTIKTECKGFRI